METNSKNPNPTGNGTNNPSITTGTAARICGCNRDTILYHAKVGHIKGQRFSNSKRSWWLFSRREVLALKERLDKLHANASD
jgi:hypothetical protein